MEVYSLENHQQNGGVDRKIIYEWRFSSLGKSIVNGRCSIAMFDDRKRIPYNVGPPR